MIHGEYAHAMLAALCAKYLVFEPYFVFLNEQVTTGIALTFGIITFWIVRDKQD